MCHTSVDIALRMTPAVTLSATFHSFSSSRYVFNSLADGASVVVVLGVAADAAAGVVVSPASRSSCLWVVRVDRFRIKCHIGVLPTNGTLDIVVPLVPVVVPKLHSWFSFCIAHGLCSGIEGGVDCERDRYYMRVVLCMLALRC